MKETSWRTLMLLTTLLAVFVIFQGTVRSPRLPAAQAQPVLAVRQLEDPNKLQNKVVRRPEAVEAIAQAPAVWLNDEPQDPDKLQDKVARRRPEAVGAIAQAPPVWLDDKPEDPNEPDEPPPPVPE